MTLRLYGYCRSSTTYRVRIALALKGLAFETVPISLRPGVDEQYSAAYLARNPEGRVPLLEDGGAAISQSLAILDYLDEICPHPPLLTGTTLERAWQRSLAHQIALDIHPLNNIAVLTYLKQALAQDEGAVSRWYAHWIRRGFAALEQRLVGRGARYCAGDAVTLPDICLVPQMWNARRFEVDLTAFPTLVRIDTALNQLDAVIAARPENQPDYPPG